MTVGKDRPELRGGAGGGAPRARRGQRHRPGRRRSLRARIHRPAGRTGSAAGAPARRTDNSRRHGGLAQSNLVNLRGSPNGGRAALRRACETPEGRQAARRRRRTAGRSGEEPRRRDLPAQQRRRRPGRRHRPARRRRRSAGSRPDRRRSTLGAAAERPRTTRQRPGARPPRNGSSDQARQIADASPGLFNSGYFVLSALDGAPPAAARAARRGDRPRTRRPGGDDAGLLRYTFNTPGSIRLNKTPERGRAELAEETGLVTGVAGGAAQLNDYSRVTRDRIPMVVIGDHPRHLPGPDPRPAGDPAGGDRGGPQPGHGRGRLRRPHPAHLPAPRTCRWAGTTTSKRSGRR